MAADRLHRSDSCWPPSAEAGSIAEDCVPASLSVVVEQSDPNVVVVSVAGEVDLLTASDLHEHVSGALVAAFPRLVIDLTDAWFLSAAALSVLVHARRIAECQGTTLQLRAPKRSLPARTLAITGLDRLVEILPPGSGTHSAPDSRGDGHAKMPGPCPISRTSISDDPTSLESCVETDLDEYEHLVPIHRRYAELAVDDPRRQRLRDQLIQGYLPVAEHLASRFAGRGEPLEDLTQVARIGLINAVDRFLPGRGSHFLAFAVPTISGEIRRYFRDHGWSTRVPRRLKDLSLAIKKATAELSQQLGRSPRPSEIAQWLGVSTSTVIDALHAGEAYRSSSLDELLRGEETTAARHTVFGELDPQMCLIDDRETLRLLLAQLTPRQRTILSLRFFHELTQNQIAKRIGLSQMHVSRLIRQTLDFLHQRMTESQQLPAHNRPPRPRHGSTDSADSSAWLGFP
jgi:RNA polymerase sigma-B factor